MILQLHPYASMRRSGAAWIGEVPSHWQVLPNRALFYERNQRERHGEQMLSVTISRGVLRQGDLLSATSKKDSSNADRSSYKYVEVGDLVYNKMRAWQGAVGASDFNGIVSPAYVVQRPRVGVLPRYAHHLMRTPLWAKEAERWSYGITSDQWSLRPEQFRTMYSPLPPIEEQTAIVRFLDHFGGRIERAIRAKRKVIALLQEQKQAIIHLAVTRGLGFGADLRATGLPWLGFIPGDWNVVRLGCVARLLTGFPFPSRGFLQDEGVRLLRGINVTPRGLRWESVVRWRREAGDELDEFMLRDGDIVLGMDRPIVGSGIRAALVRQGDLPSLLLQRVARLRPRAELDPGYMILLLQSRLFADYMKPIFTGISVPHLSPEQIRNFCVPLPPLREQRSIVAEVPKQAGTVEATESRLRCEVELLREFRIRLTADVVTGKLDVREAASRLLDEPHGDLCEAVPGSIEDASDEEAIV